MWKIRIFLTEIANEKSNRAVTNKKNVYLTLENRTFSWKLFEFKENVKVFKINY